MLRTNNLDIKFPWQQESTQSLHVHLEITGDVSEEQQGFGYFKGRQRR